ncbi:MAG: AAA family ATPase [Chloroflexales bacterium]|nr:AAA family ATPase [Chloroflexales bacterium]
MIELEPSALRRVVDPDALGIESMAQRPASTEIIGQPRAVAALRFGLRASDHGFNMYVAGPPGVGKMTTVQSLVAHEIQGSPTPSDWCYVHNFADPYRPVAHALPAGRGRALQRDMCGLVEHVRRELPRAFERDEYTSHRETLLRELNRQREQALEQLTAQAAELGFAIRATPTGVAIIPLRDGQPIPNEAFQELAAPERDRLLAQRDALQCEIDAMLKRVRDVERAMQEHLQQLDVGVALHVVRQQLDGMEERYRDLPAILAFLGAVQQDLLAHVELLQAGHTAGLEGITDEGAAQLLHRYEVNLLVEHGEGQGAPIVVERHPSYANVCGCIEREARFGTLITDFTMLRAGALHRANGGFLILSADALLSNPMAWEGLKRALLNRELQIEDAGESLGFISTRSLRPQPIPLLTKVLLVGSPQIYALLKAYDEQFGELFKIKAEFTVTMPTSTDNERCFLEVMAGYCAREQLRPLDATACAKLIEEAARQAEHRGRLSVQFGRLTDLVREASFLAQGEGADRITGEHIRQAREAYIYRVGEAQERLQELIADGSLLIATTGTVTGQVNGLAVLTTGDHCFGLPTRITASVGPGREGVLDIEREARLGGPIHSKGVLILGGYLAQTFAADRPLSLRARIVLEQSHEGVEGDSASSAELYALLSALADLPLRQGLAVTGALSQRGEIEAVGGVNEKIEGFFDTCRTAGLTGDQGVLIPQSNRNQLMLREDVVAAVAAGQFHIWAIGTVNEGMELLTGVPAGAVGPGGAFPAESVNGRVARRLQRFTESLRWSEHEVGNGSIIA